MIDWSTVASFATAVGTLVLAIATFWSVRSANRSARIAERAFQIGLRPILAPSRLDDPPQRVMFGDHHWVDLEGGRAAVEDIDGIIYLAMPVRNVGNGMAVIESWDPHPGRLGPADGWGSPDSFRQQIRALWVPPGDVAFWQGALRDEHDPLIGPMHEAIAAGLVSVDLHYRDHEDGQHTISRFLMIRRDEDDDERSGWWSSLSMHRSLDPS